MNSYIGAFISVAYIALILFIAVRTEHLKHEFSRTMVHILVTNWWFIAAYLIKDYWVAVSIPVFFILFNSLNLRFNWISAINSKSRYGNYGTIYYAISVALLTAMTFSSAQGQIVGGVGMLVMGYGDGFAALIGQRYGKHGYHIFKGSKSIEGSVSMLVVSLIALSVYLGIMTGSVNFYHVGSIALVATLVEAISPYGLDNLFVPILGSLLYFIFII